MSRNLEISSKCSLEAIKHTTLCKFHKVSKMFRPMEQLPVPRLRGRLGQVRCRKASWGCFGGRHLLEFFVALCFGRCGQM